MTTLFLIRKPCPLCGKPMKLVMLCDRAELRLLPDVLQLAWLAVALRSFLSSAALVNQGAGFAET
jgi:hypothetical protein